MRRLLVPVLLLLGNTATAHGPDKSIDFGWRAPVSNFEAGKSAGEQRVRLELAVEGNTIKLFVYDRYGDPVDIDIAEAKAFVSSAGRTSWFAMRPASMNMLAGEGDFDPDPGMRVDITLRLPGRKPINKAFWPLGQAGGGHPQ